jgi:hypothetical protein
LPPSRLVSAGEVYLALHPRNLGFKHAPAAAQVLLVADGLIQAAQLG